MVEDSDKSSCIAILGGTFNPIHKGHILLARHALEFDKEIKHVYLMPNNKPAYKCSSDIETNENRCNMIEIATKDIENISLSTIEIDRGGTTYTVDTLEYLNNKFQGININFIIGDDSLLNFKKWVNYPRILELCNLIVARRIYDYSRLKLFSDDIISKLGYGKISIMECPIFDASSSDIRNALQNGINPVGLDENVFEYIKTHKLYGWCEH